MIRRNGTYHNRKQIAGSPEYAFGPKRKARITSFREKEKPLMVSFIAGMFV
ncbi:hypothetical protein B4168_3578 [Anoxybacillus flavithermus]|nr:hypothetical protein B4168_3578 [Anoxybacillus flavithermus]OAO87244.1 hypothetical protein GT23_1427 [Parageobacillus thermoglucosidasius]